MKVIAIKFADGTYYAGANKKHARTILGAQLYISERVARNMMQTSINFPKYEINTLKLVEVELREVGNDRI